MDEWVILFNVPPKKNLIEDVDNIIFYFLFWNSQILLIGNSKYKTYSKRLQQGAKNSQEHVDNIINVMVFKMINYFNFYNESCFFHFFFPIINFFISHY
jgi:hypothetical protein